MIIFLDESGDLGFDFLTKKPSPALTITLLVCDTNAQVKEFGRARKRTLKNKLNHKKNNKRVLELKGTNTTLSVKQYFLNHAPTSGWRLYSVTLNKARVLPYLQDAEGKKKLYNFLARFVIEKIDFDDSLENVTLIVDKSKNTREMQDFNQYIENHLQAYLPLNCRLYISHEQSHANLAYRLSIYFAGDLLENSMKAANGIKHLNRSWHSTRFTCRQRMTSKWLAERSYRFREFAGKKRRPLKRLVPKAHNQPMEGST